MTQKVFLTKSGKASFFCPECGKSREMDVTRFRRIGKEVRLKATCSCGHKFPVVLERRQFVRMPVNLKGKLRFDGDVYSVTVVDISRYGVKIQTEKVIELGLDEKVLLEFQLDDANQSIVRKEVVVRSVKFPEFGLEFVDRDHYDKLGTYLLFHFK